MPLSTGLSWVYRWMEELPSLCSMDFVLSLKTVLLLSSLVTLHSTPSVCFSWLGYRINVLSVCLIAVAHSRCSMNVHLSIHKWKRTNQGWTSAVCQALCYVPCIECFLHLLNWPIRQKDRNCSSAPYSSSPLHLVAELLHFWSGSWLPRKTSVLPSLPFTGAAWCVQLLGEALERKEKGALSSWSAYGPRRCGAEPSPKRRVPWMRLEPSGQLLREKWTSV